MTNFQSKPKDQVSPYSQAHILIEIEQLVQTIIAKSKTESSKRLKRQFLIDLMFDALLIDYSRYLSAYSPVHDYSEHLEAFWYGSKAVGFITPKNAINTMIMLSEAQLSFFIDMILEYSECNQFKRRIHDRKYEKVNKRDNIQGKAKALHDKYSKLLVVRVDFHYQTQCQHFIGIDDVFAHLKSFATKIGYHELFKHEVGHAWVIEQGETLGYHIHTTFYLKGSEHQNDWHLGYQIGLLWQKVTNGVGSFYVCNNPSVKSKYAAHGKLGIGMIHRKDPVACQNSIEAVSYLAKPEKVGQYLRMKPKGKRTFVAVNNVVKKIA